MLQVEAHHTEPETGTLQRCRLGLAQGQLQLPREGVTRQRMHTKTKAACS